MPYKIQLRRMDILRAVQFFDVLNGMTVLA